MNSSSTAKTILFWISIVFLGVMLWKLVSANGAQAREDEPSYSEFMAKVDATDVKEVTLYLSPNSYELQGEYVRPANHKFHLTVFKESAPDLAKQLRDKQVPMKVKEVRSGDWVLILLNAAPLILLVGFCLFLMRQMQAGGNKALSFGKSRARLLSAQQKKATFKDVAGTDEAKEELQEIIEFLKDPQKFQKLGGRIPKGVLLVGPPGTGKTLLARAIAGEANVPFFSISGSDFVEMFVGVGASRVRDLFEQGKKNAPCIIFIDEIDAVGRHRGAGLGGGHDEREQTLNALLVEMDGFESNEGVILIAATNRPDVLDPALLRPGRFDRRVVVARPDVKGREEILRVHTRKVPISDDVELSIIARGTPGIFGRRPGEPGERGGAVGRSPEPQVRHDGGLRNVEGQSAHGRGTQVHDLVRRRKEKYRVPRSGARAGGGHDSQRGSGAQGDDYPARHGAGVDDAAARRRQAHLHGEIPGGACWRC